MKYNSFKLHEVYVNTALEQSSVCFSLEPFQDILFVFSNPLPVGHGPLDGLFQCQSPGAKANLSIVSLELLQLAPQKEK